MARKQNIPIIQTPPITSKRSITFQRPSTSTDRTALVSMVVVVFGLLGVILYLIYLNMGNGTEMRSQPSKFQNTSILSNIPSVYLSTVSTRNDPFNDPYSPPLKSDGMYFPPDSADVRGIPVLAPTTCNSSACGGNVVHLGGGGLPINMKTRGYNPDYSQIGILTRERSNRTEDTSFRDNMILPLMGRRVMNGRDAYQYYTMSNTGAVNTKLPVKVRGKNCINEYGCSELMNGDTVMVEGYNETFRATIYENNSFGYIPFL
jgi:hypothetical protein